MSKFKATHPEKILWPEEKYTKEYLINYYKSVSSFILPYLKNRPMVMHRYPNGLKGQEFYQKEIGPHPDWLKTFKVQHEDREIEYLLIHNEEALLYAVNLGSIDLNPFTSTIKNLDFPTYAVIDLDPVKISFEKVIDVAKAVHQILNSLKVDHYCKTSGGRGLHIYIPLHEKYHFDEVKLFTEMLALIIYEEMPKYTSLERSPSKREGKVYLDVLQNRSYQTVVAPYSVRPKPHAPVSTPLFWEEVKKGLDSTQFNMTNIAERLKDIGDIFKPILGAGVKLTPLLNKLKVFSEL